MAASPGSREGRPWLVGPFPPPVHGMALVNQHLERQLRARGGEPLLFNTAPSDRRASWRTRAGRGVSVALALFRMAGRAARARPGTVYISVSGGWGQAYEVGFALLARLFGGRVVLHHHSYRYLTRKRLLTSWLVRAAGRGAAHVVLCQDQGRRLRAQYPAVDRVRVVSNAAFFAQDSRVQPARSHEALRAIGFFGNVSREKGIDDFLEVCQRLVDGGGETVRAVIAGPFWEDRVERDVRRFLARNGHVEYLGPLYGPEKQRFFENVDVLIFPSRTEAEPLTVYEALAAGVPVIALDQGCLGDILRDGAGTVVRGRDEFVKSAVRQIRYWQERPDDYGRASRCAQVRGAAAAERARGALGQLVDDLMRGEATG